jgi:thiol-disulfide isomerase/thioredoxin/mono/diheme cytochrome c family protein
MPGAKPVGGPTEIRQQAKLLRPADHGVGRFIPEVEFTDIHGKPFSVKAGKDRPLTAVIMTSTSCPLSRKYLPALAEIAAEYSTKGVQFIAVNCIPTDKAEDMLDASKRLGSEVIYVHDVTETLSQHFGATSTTDVIVLDKARTVVYHGAVDDQYGIGYGLDNPRQRFLKDALVSLLTGKTPSIQATVAPGCVLEHDHAAVKTNVTYHDRVSRILQQHCVACHREGGVGPFALDSFADVVAHAPMIRQVVEQRTMPPWFAAPPAKGHASVWANDRSLPDADREDLLNWLSSDRPEGDQSHAPLPQVFPEGWTIGKPDLIVQLPEPVKIQATGTMPYVFVTAETSLQEDKWIQGYEIMPTDRTVVHHVIVNVHEKGSGRIRDREEGTGGYWAVYVPGNSGHLYPEGFARKLPAGATVSFQIHYTPNGQATEDQLQLGLVFAKKEPRFVVHTVPLADTNLNIPPNAADHVESITRPVPGEVTVMGYMAHLHVRGKSFLYELITPDGTTETLLDIPHYDFNWQLRYDYRDPKVIPAGSRVRVTAVFDNSEKNPANPDPTKTVHWGQQTFDEMLIGYFETFIPVGQAAPTMRKKPDDGQALFRLLDSDGDESLSRDEARKAIDRVPRLRDNPEILERLFDRVDKDKNDHLNVDEYNQLREQLAARR